MGTRFLLSFYHIILQKASINSQSEVKNLCFSKMGWLFWHEGMLWWICTSFHWIFMKKN